MTNLKPLGDRVKAPAELQQIDGPYSLGSAPKSKPIKLLLVEDNPIYAQLIQEMLAEAEGEKFAIDWVPYLSQALLRLSHGEIDLVLLDLGLPDSQGLDTFVQAYAQAPGVPFVLLTGFDDETLALTALRQGAQDYLVKGQTNASMLLRAIRYAIERKQAEVALETERQKLFYVLDNLPATVCLRATDFSFRFTNRMFREVFGEPGNKPCYEILWERREPCEGCQLLEVAKTEVPQKIEVTIPGFGRTYQLHHYPFRSNDGSRLVLTLGSDITERKQAEQALQESEKKYRTIVETAQEGIWIIDAAGRTIFANPRMADMLGCAITDMLGREVFYFIEEEDRPEAEQHLWRLSQGMQEIADRCFRLPDGTNLWTIVSAQPLFDEASRYIGAFAMVTDITDRKVAEEALRESNDRLRTLIQTSPTAIVALDVDGKVTLWNPAAKQIFGWGEEEALGRNYSHLVNAKQRRADFENLLGRVLQGESFTGLEFPRQRKDGAQIYINSSAAPLHDAGGKVMGVMAVMQDVTERKRAEAALQESQWRFKQVVENSPFPLVLVDANNDIEYLNPKFLQTTGYTLKDLPNLRVWTYLAYPDRHYRKKVMETWGSVLKRAMQEGKEIEPVEFQVTCKDGTVRIMEIFGAPMSEGKYFAVFKDLTERKRTEEKLRVSEQNLRYLTSQLFTAQERERRRISYELHDELGQSLLTLKLMARSIARGKNLKHIKDACQQMRSYLDEVVENVRLLSKELSPRGLENFGLSTALKRQISDFAKHYQFEQLHTEIDEINDLFSMEARLNLYRIIQECLTNIGKHGQATQLSVIVKRQTKTVTFQVEDNGNGFNVALILNDKNGRQGIGLASMEERVRMLGGGLKIRSQEGQGTRISFAIPITSDTQQVN